MMSSSLGPSLALATKTLVLLLVATPSLLLAPICAAQRFSGATKSAGPFSVAGPDSTRLEQSGGEQVDKLSSAAGDLYLAAIQHPLASLGGAYWQLAPVGSSSGQEAAPMRYQTMEQPSNAKRSFGAPITLDYAGTSPLVVDPLQQLAGLRNYRALVDDFKSWSHLSNPMREGRAFKPKLMSTARGFGKRVDPSVGSARVISLEDLLAASNAAGKPRSMMRLSQISPKAFEWLCSQFASKQCEPLGKFVLTEKTVDYNGDGFISAREKEQSLRR